MKVFVFKKGKCGIKKTSKSSITQKAPLWSFLGYPT
jgi:hypothetical protein